MHACANIHRVHSSMTHLRKYSFDSCFYNPRFQDSSALYLCIQLAVIVLANVTCVHASHRAKPIGLAEFEPESLERTGIVR